MTSYRDVDGALVEAIKLDAPMLLNTLTGEACGEPGQWLVYLPSSLPVFMSDEAFSSSFTLVN